MKEFRLLTPEDIEVKVKQVSAKGAVALLYKTARTDMAILDETVGAENWECDYKVIKDNLYCGIGVTFEDGRTVWKWDCGIESREDGEGNEKKGEASDAFKRAGFKWGIGRELYTSPFIFLGVPTKANDRGKYELVDRFAKFKVLTIDYDGRSISKVVICDQNGEVVFPKKAVRKPTKAEMPTTDTLCEADEIGCDLEKWSRHLGKTYDELTDEEVKECIRQKQRYLDSLRPPEEA